MVGTGTVVAIVDTAVAANHEELKGQVLDGYDAIRDQAVAAGTGVFDLGEGVHGTHVAAIVAARRDVGPIIGVAPGARILPVRAITPQGGVASDVTEGIIWAVDHGAHVVNLSLTSPVQSSAITNAIQYAVNRGVTVVAAGGNSGTTGNVASWPAADANTIAVAATDVNDRRWADSTTGATSTSPRPASTSTARPAARRTTRTSVAPRWRPRWSPAPSRSCGRRRPTSRLPQLRSAVYSTALDLGGAGPDTEYGYGRIRPADAIAQGSRSPPRSSSSSPRPPIGRVRLRWSAPAGISVARYDLYVDGAPVAHCRRPRPPGRTSAVTGAGGSVYQVRVMVAGPGRPRCRRHARTSVRAAPSALRRRQPSRATGS